MDYERKHLRDILLNDVPRTHLERLLDTQAAIALNLTCREFRHIPELPTRNSLRPTTGFVVGRIVWER
jgi:hypothetical protein